MSILGKDRKLRGVKGIREFYTASDRLAMEKATVGCFVVGSEMAERQKARIAQLEVEAANEVNGGWR